MLVLVIIQCCFFLNPEYKDSIKGNFRVAITYYDNAVNRWVLEISTSGGVITSSEVTNQNDSTWKTASFTISTNIVSGNLPNDADFRVRVVSGGDLTIRMVRVTKLSSSFFHSSSLENFDYYNSYSGISPEFINDGGYLDTPAGGGSYNNKLIRNDGTSFKSNSLYYNYNLPSIGDTVGFFKSFTSHPDWSGYDSISLKIKGTGGIEPWRFYVKESDNDEWVYFITNITETWQKITIPLNKTYWSNVDWDTDGGNNTFGFFTVAKWGLNTTTTQGGKNNVEVWVDEINFEAASGSDKTPPTFTNFSPVNGATNISLKPSIYYEIDDDTKVDNTSIMARISLLTFISAENFMRSETVAIDNGGFNTGYSGNIISDGGNGYNVTITPDPNFPKGTEIVVDLFSADISGNYDSDSFSFITKGVAFGKTSPTNNEINVFTNTSVEIYANNLKLDSAVVYIDSTLAFSNNLSAPGYNVSTYGYGTPLNNRIVINPDMPFGFNSVHNIFVYGSDTSGNYTTNLWSFRVISDKPEIQNLYPTNNQSAVPLSDYIFFRLVDDSQIVKNTINVSLNGEIAILNGSIMGDYEGTIGLNKWNGYDVYVRPKSGFAQGVKYSVGISAYDDKYNFVSTNISFYSYTMPNTVADPAGGVFFDSIDVTLKSLKMAIIYYTTDNTTPTTNSLKFTNSGTVHIDKSIMLKFYSIDNDGNQEQIREEQYEIIKTSENAVVIPNVVNISRGEKLKIWINKEGNAEVYIYNVLGFLVKKYDKRFYNKGDYELYPLTESDSNIGVGIYIVVIKGKDWEVKKKCLIVK